MRDRVTVDSFAFARDKRELVGNLPVAELNRLQDALYDRSGEIKYNLTGSTNKDGIASLRLVVEGDLSLACQRCLGPVKFRMHSDRMFELVAPGMALVDPADEPEEVEQMHADAALDVAMLVEDEVLLSLPMVAAHPAGECAALATQASGNENMSPFSSLGVLKRQ